MGKAREKFSLSVGENEEQERCYSGSTKREKESPLGYIVGHVSSQECRRGTKAPKLQRTSRAPRRHSER